MSKRKAHFHIQSILRLYPQEATSDERDTASKRNDGEVGLVVAHVRKLLATGLTAADMCVITPYNAQVDALRQALSEKYPKLEIGSVDGFQGLVSHSSVDASRASCMMKPNLLASETF